MKKPRFWAFSIGYPNFVVNKHTKTRIDEISSHVRRRYITSKGYAMEANQKPHQHATKDQARAARQRAIDFARASVGLEGFSLSPEVEAINCRFIDGKLTGEEHIAAIRAAVLHG